MELRDSTIYLNETIVIDHNDRLVRNTIYYSADPAIYMPREVAEAEDFEVRENTLKRAEEPESVG